jgi:CDP-glucose 4,6-dehydratase
MPFGDFYRGKRVLITGHTGFKGSWLASWLNILGAEVSGIALEPNTDPALFNILRLEERLNHRILDIREPEPLAEHMAEVSPDVVFHMAAQPLVRLSYEIPLETLDTNLMGTAYVLRAIDRAGYGPERPCGVVVITSDKCYENCETYTAYREDEAMGGHDVYSASKGMAELLVASWRRSFYTDGPEAPAVRLASCRAGNVIGGGDWSADRIMVDAINALMAGEPIPVRNPLSVRPWQHVLEPLSGYLQVGAALLSEDTAFNARTAWNFGPGRESERTVAQLCDAIVAAWGGGAWTHTPDAEAVHEARFLKLAIDKVWHYLGWQPVWDFKNTIGQTVSWYKLAHESGFETAKMRDKTREQILEYSAAAAATGLPWADGE